MTQLPAATPKQLIGMANVIFAGLGSSAQQFATSRSHDRSAPASRCPLWPGTPQAKRRTRSRRQRSSRTKERAEAAFTSRPAAGSSDDLAFQQQTAVSSVIHFSAWTPLRRILPHRRSYIAAGGTASVSR